MRKCAFYGSVIFVMLLLLSGIIFGEDIKLPVQTHQSAIDIANRVSGFDKIPNFSEVAITVQKVVVALDDSMMYKWIEGRSFWKVSYSGITIEKDGMRNPYINAFDVLVDVETGRVPKIVSQWMSGINPKYKLSEAKNIAGKREIVAREYNQEWEKMFSVPDRYPKITFLESLKLSWEEAEGKTDPFEKRIVAIYRWGSYGDEKDAIVPAWDLTAYGGRYASISIPNDGEGEVRSPDYKGPDDDTNAYKEATMDADTGVVFASGGTGQ